MRKDHLITPGDDCGHELIYIYLPTAGRTVRYCKQRGCANYYKCSCGVIFGQHEIDTQTKSKTSEENEDTRGTESQSSDLPDGRVVQA